MDLPNGCSKKKDTARNLFSFPLFSFFSADGLRSPFRFVHSAEWRAKNQDSMQAVHTVGERDASDCDAGGISLLVPLNGRAHPLLRAAPLLNLSYYLGVVASP
jgi:hypothetical protein